MGKWFQSGSPWVWITSSAVSLSLIAVLGLLLLIAWRGLSYFWPAAIYQWQLQAPTVMDTATAQTGEQITLIGQLYDQEQILWSKLSSDPQDAQSEQVITRYLIKTGNREFVPLDFRWIDASTIISEQQPPDLAMFERVKNGNFYGYPQTLLLDGQAQITDDLASALTRRIKHVADLTAQALRLQKTDIGAVNYQLEKLRLQQREYELKQQLTPELQASFAEQRQALELVYQGLEKQLFELRRQTKREAIIVQDMRGQQVELNLSQILDVSYPNAMSWGQKLLHWAKNITLFVSEDPREGNTEGGVFPAIFGTVFMVMLMAVIVTPFGVIAAIYLHEYAKKGAVTRLIRIAVINLAGVPSIVYGVFGLGFFVYVLGGSIDDLFYPEALPAPTFGSPGVLWSALTLAILTLPVVIVSTEEGLSRIPSAVRQASYALGATKAETLWRVVVPMASPAIMTGLILAVARAAGEVAPLMLVGVVKLAPSLPVDMNFPFIHLDRQFMHLGFHIYDVGFQSPNVEAARPLVYATSLLLVMVIISLNLTAIAVRNHLREKYRAFDN